MSVSAAQLALVLGAQAVALSTPGPALISIVQKAIGQGRGPAMRFGAGLAFGATSWIVASMLGLGLILHRFPQGLQALRLPVQVGHGLGQQRENGQILCHDIRRRVNGFQPVKHLRQGRPPGI